MCITTITLHWTQIADGHLVRIFVFLLGRVPVDYINLFELKYVLSFNGFKIKTYKREAM